MSPRLPELSREDLLREAREKGFLIQEDADSIRVFHPIKNNEEGPIGIDFDLRPEVDREVSFLLMLKDLLENTND